MSSITTYGRVNAQGYVYNPNTLSWEPEAQADIDVSTTNLELYLDGVEGKLDNLLTELQLKGDLSETQPVSLASVPSHAVTNAGTFAVQVTSAPTTAVTGPLTDAQLRATAVSVSGTVNPIITEVTATAALAALNDAVTIALQGRPFVGATLNNGTTFNGSLTMEFSTDSGVTWDERFFFNGDNWTALDVLPHAEEPIRTYDAATQTADTHMRIRVAAYSSGTTTVILRANGIEPFAANFITSIVMQPITLNALNAEIQMPIWMTSFGFFLRTGTLSGTLVVESSPDSHGNTTWTSNLFFADNAWRLSWAVAGTIPAGPLSIPLTGGTQRLRLRVSAYTSGSVIALVRQSYAQESLSDFTKGLTAFPVPYFGQLVGGTDGTNLRALKTDTSGELQVDVLTMPPVTANSSATATAADPVYTEGAASNLSQDLGGRQRMLAYAHVSDAPEAFVPADVKPLSMTTDGRIRVASAEARFAPTPFSDEDRELWGVLQAWDNGPKPYFQGSPWASW